jgi:hypothetical protein
MEPTLRRNWDYVLALPVDRYTGEGLYVFDQLGGMAIYRCEACLGKPGSVHLMSDSPHYGSHVLAKVVADVKVRSEHDLMSAVAEKASV